MEITNDKNDHHKWVYVHAQAKYDSLTAACSSASAELATLKLACSKLASTNAAVAARLQVCICVGHACMNQLLQTSMADGLLGTFNQCLLVTQKAGLVNAKLP